MSSNNLPTLLWNKLKFVVIGPPGFLCDWQGSVYFKEKFLRGVEFSDHCRENKAIRRRAVEQYNKEGGQWWIFAGASYVRKATDKEIGKWVTYQHNNMVRYTMLPVSFLKPFLLKCVSNNMNVCH
jgi:hypothetical protein